MLELLFFDQNVMGQMATMRRRNLLCRLHHALLSLAEGAQPWFRARECPCCGWRGIFFRSFATTGYLRWNALCPRCGSLERHRALSFYYPKFFASLEYRPGRVVHFAPESCLERTLKPLCDCYQRSAYGEDWPAELRLDLNNLALPDESCDLLLMNHVLDCMQDVRHAPGEIHRVLRGGGRALALVGYTQGAFTREFGAAMCNSMWRVYGSEDLEKQFSPLAVSVVNAAGNLDAETRRRFGIPASVPLLILKKTAASVPLRKEPVEDRHSILSRLGD